MTASTFPGPKSRKAGPGKTGAELGPGRLIRMLAVETVPDTGLDIRLCASKIECAALADDCDLVAVQTFEAGFHVRKQGPENYKVSGVLYALVTQTCGVSLEPFETMVSAPVDVDFAPSRQSLGEPAGRKMTAGGAAIFAGPQDPPIRLSMAKSILAHWRRNFWPCISIFIRASRGSLSQTRMLAAKRPEQILPSRFYGIGHKSPCFRS